MGNNKLSWVAIRMVEQPPLYSREPMDSPLAAVRVMRGFLSQMDRELFCIINLRSDLCPINMNIVSVGALNQSLIHPREVFKTSILSNAAGIMLIHNHPSGRLEPSREDIVATDRLQQAGRVLGIPVFDHVIVGSESVFFSFRERRNISDVYPKYAKSLDEIRFDDNLAAESGVYLSQSQAVQQDTSAIKAGHSQGKNQSILERLNEKRAAVKESSCLQYKKIHGKEEMGLEL